MIQGFLKRLMENKRIKQYIQKNNTDLIPEFIKMVEMGSLAD